MKQRFATTNVLDVSAISLSGLCLIHCLFLPLAAALLPLAGAWAEAEWVHKAFVGFAVPVSGYLIWRAIGQRGSALFIGLASLGLILLTAAAFLESLHEHETAITVTGALLLASAHIIRWRTHAICPHDHN